MSITNILREKFLLGQVDRLGGLVVIAETRVRSLVQARIFSLNILVILIFVGFYGRENIWMKVNQE